MGKVDVEGGGAVGERGEEAGEGGGIMRRRRRRVGGRRSRESSPVSFSWRVS